MNAHPKAPSVSVLYIEPLHSAAVEPLIDSLTRRSAFALAHSRPGRGWGGAHRCTCGAHSTSTDHIFTGPCGGGFVTHALLVHYLAYHRDEIPESELSSLAALLPADESDPTPRMLRGWHFGERVIDEPWMM